MPFTFKFPLFSKFFVVVCLFVFIYLFIHIIFYGIVFSGIFPENIFMYQNDHSNTLGGGGAF